MKKIAAVVLAVIVALGVFWFVGTGFKKQTNVVLTGYAVSADGTRITFDVGVASSMGFVRDYKDEGGGVKPHYLKFYSAFGGLNSSFGSKNSFVLEIAPDDTEIYFYQGNGGYKLVLEKNEQTGEWKPSVTGVVEEVHDDYVIMYSETAEGYPNGSHWSVPLDVENQDSYTNMVAGDEIVVYYDGSAMETDPL